MPLIKYYFWDETDGGAVYAPDVQEFSKKIIQSHKKYLRTIISKYVQ
jgi:hypothetical protein